MQAAPEPESPSLFRAPFEGTVLVIDDEPAIGEVLDAALRIRGYDVHVARDAADGLQVASAIEPDLYVVDLGLPDLDGIEVCRRLRRWTANPIIVLTVDDGEDRKVEAFDAGADDYLAKPFSMPELMARVRVANRHRNALTRPATSGALSIGRLLLDVTAHAAEVDGEPLQFGPKEFALLSVLAANANRIVPQSVLILSAWNEHDSRHSETLRTHMNQVRRKLTNAEAGVEIINERGVGYRLVASTDCE